LQQLGLAHSRCQIVQDDSHGDTGAFDTRLPVAEMRVADNIVAPIHRSGLHHSAIIPD